MLFCQKSNSNKKGVFVQEAHPALEGTKCNNGKVLIII